MDLTDRARKAIREVFDDTSVSQEDTICRLEDLAELISELIGAIEADLERRNELQ